jgi:hypothetical protein
MALSTPVAPDWRLSRSTSNITPSTKNVFVQGSNTLSAHRRPAGAAFSAVSFVLVLGRTSDLSLLGLGDARVDALGIPVFYLCRPLRDG